MLFTLGVVTFAMVLSRGAGGLGSIFVVFGSLSVFVSFHWISTDCVGP
jgi:hypothetical protein